MDKIRIFALLLFIFLYGCSKQILDFESGEYFGVKEFLKSDNCDTKCGLQASCEGKTVRLKGIIDEDNINEQNGTFRITDEDDENYYIDIAVDDGISEEIFSKIKDKGGMPVKTEGVAEGFDMPTNFTCKRGFFLKASDASEIIF